MTQRTLETLTDRTDQFCQGSGLKFIFEDQTKKLIQDVLHGIYENPAQRADYVALIERIRVACVCSESLMSATIGTIGYELYSSTSPELAEMIFRLAVEISPEKGVKNNLAYVCRRHKKTLNTSDVEIIDLLLSGVMERDAFSLMNMALHFALNLAEEDDWKLADRMVRLMRSDDDGISSVAEWWNAVAIDGGDEGWLVLRWLERHKKHESLHVPAAEYDALRNRCPDIPKWIFDPYSSE